MGSDWQFTGRKKWVCHGFSLSTHKLRRCWKNSSSSPLHRVDPDGHVIYDVHERQSESSTWRSYDALKLRWESSRWRSNAYDLSKSPSLSWGHRFMSTLGTSIIDAAALHRPWRRRYDGSVLRWESNGWYRLYGSLRGSALSQRIHFHSTPQLALHSYPILPSLSIHFFHSHTTPMSLSPPLVVTLTPLFFRFDRSSFTLTPLFCHSHSTFLSRSLTSSVTLVSL